MCASALVAQPPSLPHNDLSFYFSAIILFCFNITICMRIFSIGCASVFHICVLYIYITNIAIQLFYTFNGQVFGAHVKISFGIIHKQITNFNTEDKHALQLIRKLGDWESWLSNKTGSRRSKKQTALSKHTISNSQTLYLVHICSVKHPNHHKYLFACIQDVKRCLCVSSTNFSTLSNGVNGLCIMYVIYWWWLAIVIWY